VYNVRSYEHWRVFPLGCCGAYLLRPVGPALRRSASSKGGEAAFSVKSQASGHFDDGPNCTFLPYLLGITFHKTDSLHALIFPFCSGVLLFTSTVVYSIRECLRLWSVAERTCGEGERASDNGIGAA
jgi:hypothetical protein